MPDLTFLTKLHFARFVFFRLVFMTEVGRIGILRLAHFFLGPAMVFHNCLHAIFVLIHRIVGSLPGFAFASLLLRLIILCGKIRA